MPLTSADRFAAGLGMLLALAPEAALAQATLDLSGTYGNPAGCLVARSGATPTEEALIVRSDRFESASSTCEFVQVIPAKDNVKIVMALCQLEDEEGRGVSLFSISPGKTDPATLIIRDEYGASWDEVRPCQ
jgi:hypothetical protein